MAKSLKSKSKRHFRAIKRADPKSIYAKTEALRLARLSDKLQESAAKPKALTDAEEYRRKQDGYTTDDESIAVETPGEAEAGASGSMELDDGAPEGDDKKVSTSGPRLSRREAYRSHKGFQIRLPPKTHFRSRGEGKRMGCKPHRRR